MAFIVFELLKELNQTAPRFTTQVLDRNQCIHGRSQKFFPGRNVEILLNLHRLLTMQCKWQFTKRFTLSAPFGLCWLNLNFQSFSEMFSTLRLSKMLLICFIFFFEHFLHISHAARIINGQNNMSGEKKVKHSQNCFKP